MALFWVTLLFGLIMLIKGSVMLFKPKWTERAGRTFLRSNLAAILTMGTATAWFLWHLSTLGAADFGEYKGWLMLLFGAVGVLSFFHIRDFLAVRGWAICVLLLADFVLGIAYMQEPASRLFLVTYMYFMIVVAMYFGVAPYRVRDLYDWMFARRLRHRAISIFTLTYGALLTGVAFMY